MKKHRNLFIALVISCLALLLVAAAPFQAGNAVVHAVLFYSPTCAHCELVRTKVLPPLYEKYGTQLDLLEVDVTQVEGRDLFLAAIDQYGLEGGVPTLIVGDNVLVGSVDIPDKFPGLIDQYLADGGVGFPEIAGLAEMVGGTTPASEPVPTPSLSEKIQRDPLGNGLAIAVLAGMLASVFASPFAYRRSPEEKRGKTAAWLLPALCLVGLGIAGYMTYVETAQVSAVCGPVGDCNAVQESSYARLFGVLPIGILGLAGYLAILGAWAMGRLSDKRLANYGNLALIGLSGFGILFSIYLTFLEPFIIGATCAWCLTTALIMTAIFWLSLEPGKAALAGLAATPASAPEKRKRRYTPASKSMARRKRQAREQRSSTWWWVVLALVVAGVVGFQLWPKSAIIQEISPEQAYQKYQQGAFFLDVRDVDDWQQAHIPNSLPIPLDELESRLGELPRDRDIVVVCLSGLRSKTGASILYQAGFRDASCLSGGLQAWSAAGYPLEGTP
jgi:rhodanese-related sulfurtransferase/uncharacterized membrane protein/thiol-disulfide isomerase/thioredoxin